MFNHIVVQSVQEGHMCTQHTTEWVLPVDRLFHCLDMHTGSIKQMEDIRWQQSRHHPRRNSISYMEACAISIKSCWSHIKRDWSINICNIHTKVEGTTMAFTGAMQLAHNRVQHFHRKHGCQKVHVARLQTPKDITQRLSKLKRLIRVIAYCRIFINNCRHPKGNRQTTTLSTQDLDQAHTCCVKTVQQISHAQEMKGLMEHQEVAATSSLKTLHSFIDQEGLLRLGGRLQQSTLPYQARHRMILPSNQSNLFVSRTLSNWRTIDPLTLYRLR